MIKTITAKYSGRCARTGNPIRAGDTIIFNTHTRQSILKKPGFSDRYISDVFNLGGAEFYRNKAGRCEDAPCCGCCTI
jgi:hypothetical protein